jgi:hypothetical protein
MTRKAQLLHAIRTFCIDCSGGSKRQATECVAYTCALHPFRCGRDPDPSATRGFARTNVCTSNFDEASASSGDAGDNEKPP